MKPMVLDFDRSVGSIPTARVIDLAGWQEAIRFSCSMSQLGALGLHLQPMLREQQGTVTTCVFRLECIAGHGCDT